MVGLEEAVPVSEVEQNFDAPPSTPVAAPVPAIGKLNKH
jgi:hypothetical protein